MPEQAEEVKTFQVQYICDECGIGYMEPSGRVLDSFPPLYPHQCMHCGYEDTYRKSYPVMVIQRV